MSPPRRTDQHRCPGQCGRHVPNHLFACPDDWARLPDHLAKPITEHHGRDRMRHADAMIEARDWYIEHPATPGPDVRIEGACDYCAAPLLWLTTGAGKRMPVDRDPDPVRGNVVRIGDVAGVLGAGPAAAARADGKPLWVHHVVTCPHADRWRSKGRTEATRRPKGPRR